MHAHTETGLPTLAVLLMTRVDRRSLPWALWRLVRGPAALRRVPGLRFARVLGSGRRGGFGLKPGLDCQGVFAMFDSLDAAESFVQNSPVVAAYRSHAAESFTAVLKATSARGSWAGQGMAVADGASASVPGSMAHPTPVAALTRASIRPAKAWRFWRHSPPAEAELAQAPGCRLAVGLGEAPVLRQATFSIWDSPQAMDAYARSGSHQRAIRASYDGGYFSESMFVRFAPVSVSGHWHGQVVGHV